jgi:hypothetical protein
MNLDAIKSQLLEKKEAQEAIKKAAHEEILKINRKLRGLAFLNRDAEALLEETPIETLEKIVNDHP